MNRDEKALVYMEQLKDLRYEKRMDYQKDGEPDSIYKKDYDALDWAIQKLERTIRRENSRNIWKRLFGQKRG